jgi:hypothetical protein
MDTTGGTAARWSIVSETRARRALACQAASAPRAPHDRDGEFADVDAPGHTLDAWLARLGPEASASLFAQAIGVEPRLARPSHQRILPQFTV